MKLDRTQFSSMTLPQILKLRAETHGEALALREKDRGLWRRLCGSVPRRQMAAR